MRGSRTVRGNRRTSSVHIETERAECQCILNLFEWRVRRDGRIPCRCKRCAWMVADPGNVGVRERSSSGRALEEKQRCEFTHLSAVGRAGRDVQRDTFVAVP